MEKKGKKKNRRKKEDTKLNARDADEFLRFYAVFMRKTNKERESQ